MSPYTLSLKSMRHRKWTVLLTTLSLALGIALLLCVERVRHQAKTSFTNTISGTDLIVGARSGSVSLLLSSVFHIGNATQNISWKSYQNIKNNPQVAWTIPLSLGDSHRGFRVLGTDNNYFTHYRYGNKQPLEFAQGKAFETDYDAVLGAEVAAELGYSLGDELVLSHGTGEVCFVDHEEHPFTITGILAPTGTPVDRSVTVSLQGIDAIHAGWNQEPEHDFTAAEPQHQDRLAEFERRLAGEDSKATQQPKEITAFMVGMHSRPDAVMLQRSINTYKGEALSAVLPGVALLELWSVVSVVEKTLLAISSLVLAIALTNMLSTLLTSLKERRREIAILRSVGARPIHLVGLVISEALVVTITAVALACTLLYTALIFARPILQSRFGLHLEITALSAEEWTMVGIILGAGLLVGFLPAWMCYRKSLADGLSIKL